MLETGHDRLVPEVKGIVKRFPSPGLMHRRSADPAEAVDLAIITGGPDPTYLTAERSVACHVAAGAIDSPHSAVTTDQKGTLL